MDVRGHIATSAASFVGGIGGAYVAGFVAAQLSIVFLPQQEHGEGILWAVGGAIVGAAVGAGWAVFVAVKLHGPSRPVATAVLVVAFVAAAGGAAIALDGIGAPVLVLMYPTAPALARAVANALPGGRSPTA